VTADGTDIDRRGSVRRIAAECAYVDDRGGVGIRLEPAAAIVRSTESNSAHRAVRGGLDR
jgi:hypothetical protein